MKECERVSELLSEMLFNEQVKDRVNDVLERIRAEIIELYNDRQNTQDSERTIFFRKVLDIIDKYKEQTE